MSTESQVYIVFFIALVVIVVGGLLWMVVDTKQMKRERVAALDACWGCGWGRVEYIQDEYRCLILEDGAEAVRSIEWVQENACSVLER